MGIKCGGSGFIETFTPKRNRDCEVEILGGGYSGVWMVDGAGPKRNLNC